MTPVKSEIVNAPYIEEFPVVLECEVLKIVEIGLHTQFIGEIKDIKADESILTTNDLPDITKVKPFIYDAAGPGYYGLGDFLGKCYSVGRKKSECCHPMLKRFYYLRRDKICLYRSAARSNEDVIILLSEHRNFSDRGKLRCDNYS